REGNPALTFEELSKPRAAGVSGNKNNIDALMAAQEVKPGNFLILPNMQLPWQDNTREYKKRFAHKNEAVFKGQFAILDKLLALNESLGIETLIVNMPVTPMNMKLMPKGSYESYSAALNTVAQKRQVKVLDLNGTFDMSCFRDTVHMNGKGGAALLQAIAATLSEDKREQLSGKAPLPF
ncbi:MAG TPA: SGNH/GDSL hydrolase family protein, partial [Candidatus Obscuribacter sp.]|nr:SGNH/GDSL hydrolase family protein [Candidatus Obscuribacter sp.]